MSKYGLLMPLLLILASSVSIAQSESNDEGKTQKEFRFEFREIAGKLYRMDRMTGAVEEIGGAQDKVVELSSTRADRLTTDNTQTEKRNRPPVINLDGDPVSAEAPTKLQVPAEITDVHRQAAEQDVRSYMGKLGIIQTIHISGDRLTGWVTVRNNGEKELRALELTIHVPTHEGQTQSYPLVMGYQSGQIAPPQPANGEGSPAQAQVMKVDYPAPSVVRGKIDIKPTYLCFAE